PLRASQYKTIAVIGPNSASLAALEGNYNGVALHPEMPVDAIEAAFPQAHVVYEQGALYTEGFAVPAPRTLFRPSAKSEVEGLQAEYFAGNQFAGQPVMTRVDPQLDFDWSAVSPLPGNPGGGFSVRWTGVIVPPAQGSYNFSLQFGRCRPCGAEEHVTITVDGKQVVSTDASVPAPRGVEGDTSHERDPVQFALDFANTRPQKIQIEMQRASTMIGSGFTLQWQPANDLLVNRAVEAVKRADLVIAMVGLSPRLEGEEMPVHLQGFDGGDRTDIALPATQAEMLEKVGATGKPMIAVLLNGSALSVNWIQQNAKAVLEAWYPGEAGSQAIADTISGENNPAGRLPITFYASLDQLPPFTDYAMKNRTYRYFTGKPLYRFGYGLSYTKFSYANLKLSADSVQAGDALTATADVTNTGQLAGDEVAQLYLIPPRGGNDGLSPHLQLEGFERLHLQPGETRQVTFRLTPRQLSEVDAKGIRSVQPGSYSIAVGGAQPDDPMAPAQAQHASFTIVGTDELPH
ncbi:MAG: glycoside hydrolase family 3 C-terminal domain-containing protein, partial [Acidobacteriota bacterium]